MAIVRCKVCGRVFDNESYSDVLDHYHKTVIVDGVEKDFSKDWRCFRVNDSPVFVINIKMENYFKILIMN